MGESAKKRGKGKVKREEAGNERMKWQEEVMKMESRKWRVGNHNQIGRGKEEESKNRRSRIRESRRRNKWRGKGEKQEGKHAREE